ncbi:uncharacterized protein MONBRDRAFT_37391 [Monosiga brevicollis MX1]|uniref:Thioredoxin domain-containing protein 12 n=1 Tax=Monosiga brevicollis TaxID=81824 RepID=A9V1F0_MONBE|nr:uncharacterized protein MONBRDRAFT_37391 [Monosiga brevicollis MX1]EDQ88428.1 predicted protein [Monosiga brevicollis MX1]|eukprot:XP_001746532.1 hypothetical protein [Monosiga brevicollis MX1]
MTTTTMAVALVALVAMIAVPSAMANDLARGWGDGIAWRSLDAGRAEALETGKPMMVIIHKSWCGACKALRPKFAANDEVAELSEKFVMVNLEDNEEPDDAAFRPDGGYIPRIIFTDAQGEVVDSIYNSAGSPKYKYYYTDGQSVAAGMKSAIKHFNI